jgi:hypothetical protein
MVLLDHQLGGPNLLFFWSCFGPPNIGSLENPPKWENHLAQTTHNALSKYLGVFGGPRLSKGVIWRGPDLGSIWEAIWVAKDGVNPGTYLDYRCFAVSVPVHSGVLWILE